jgi:hypothetical protein
MVASGSVGQWQALGHERLSRLQIVVDDGLEGPHRGCDGVEAPDVAADGPPVRAAGNDLQCAGHVTKPWREAIAIPDEVIDGDGQEPASRVAEETVQTDQFAGVHDRSLDVVMLWEHSSADAAAMTHTLSIVRVSGNGTGQCRCRYSNLCEIPCQRLRPGSVLYR